MVFAAILDARDTDGNWLYAYRHFPKRMVRWRPQYAFMERETNINTPHVARLSLKHRHIFKPRRTEKPYCDYVGWKGEEEDDEFDD